MNRIHIVQTILNRIEADTYLEIGVSWGSSFTPIRAPRKIAVDPVLKMPRFLRGMAQRGAEETLFFELTSDDFFARHAHLFDGDPIDVAFIDGLHTYEQSLRDVENSLKHLNEGGVIVMHDCNPMTDACAWPAQSYEAAKAIKPRGWTGEWCGDVWKAIVHLRSLYDDLEVFVLDCDRGVGVVHRNGNGGALSYREEEIRNLGFADLKRDRKELLNLQRPEYLYEFVNRLSVTA